MHEAAKRGNFVFLKECIRNKVSVNSLDQASNSALHWVVTAFLQFWINSRTLSLFDQSKQAAYGGHQECIQVLFLCDNLIIDLQVIFYRIRNIIWIHLCYFLEQAWGYSTS